MGIVFGNNPAIPFKIGSKTELIGESISRIVMTLPGERLGLPNFGTNVRKYLFENDIVSVQKLIKLELLAVLERQEPRIVLKSINLTDIGDDYRSFIMAIEFIEKDEPQIPKTIFLPLLER